jgi:hypothetical protein
MGGLYGGRWFNSPSAALDTEAGLRKLAWKNPREYDEAKADAFSYLLPPPPGQSGAGFFVAGHFAYRAGALLPPFLPHVRNDDMIWAFMVRAGYCESEIAYMPFALSHEPAGRAPFEQKQNEKMFFSVNGFILALLNRIAPRYTASGPADRMERFLAGAGASLCESASLGESAFKELSMTLYLEQIAQNTLRLEAKLEEGHAKPKFWAADVAEKIHELQESAAVITPWIPAEFAVFGEKGSELFRSYLGKVGELFIHWPRIWKAAAAVKGGD